MQAMASSEPGRPAVGPQFILNPDWDQMPQPRRMTRGLLKLWGLGFLGSIVLWQLFGRLSEAAGYENILESELEQWSVTEQFLLVVVLAPLFEELIYRLPLQARFRPALVALSLVAGAIFFAGANGMSFWLILLLAVVAGVTAFNSDVREAVEAWWKQYPRAVIYVVTLIFGLIHIVNFDVNWSLPALLVAPLVVSPQIWLGLMFTIARVRYGWWAGLALHAAHNGFIWSVSVAIG